MTEAEWLADADPLALLLAAGPRATERKVRLFCVACCWQVLHLAPASRQKSAGALLAVAERFADGWATKAERLAAQKKAKRSYSMVYAALPARCTPSGAFYAARHAAEFAEGGNDGVEYDVTKAAQAALARDLLGPPDDRPADFPPAWRTDAAVTLARQMYDTRDFGAMPILADALQNAGCDNYDILNHCRGSGPHVRGCWVCDLVLGKE